MNFGIMKLEALLATGHIEQALALAQNVYLSEERLKSFLIIARRKKTTQFQ